MRILTFTTLFPNAARPTFGVFVENRLRHLVASGAVSAHVVAPVPWFPFTSPRFGDYAAFARAPKTEVRHGLRVDHPRYPLIPKIGMTLTPWLLYAALRPVLARLARRGDGFDLIDAHYFYPDGVAAVMLARALDKPVTITARGTDLNLIPRYAAPRRMIKEAAARADGLITVCQALKDTLGELGVAPERVTVLRNGVDLEIFHPPRDRAALRAELGLAGPSLFSAGYLVTRKAHHLTIAALAELPGVRFLLAGTGPEEGALRQLARERGVADRVDFLGQIPHDQLHRYYGAADAFVLASSREGWANVLLESMACGTPVVASNVWGAPEIVTGPEAGVLMAERTPTGVAEGVRRLLAAPCDRAATRRYAEGFSWDETTAG